MFEKPTAKSLANWAKKKGYGHYCTGLLTLNECPFVGMMYAEKGDDGCKNIICFGEFPYEVYSSFDQEITIRLGEYGNWYVSKYITEDKIKMMEVEDSHPFGANFILSSCNKKKVHKKIIDGTWESIG